MTKDELLSIQFSVNSRFGGTDNQIDYKAINSLNSYFRDIQDKIEKNKLELLNEIDQLKNERENLNPMHDSVMSMYDFVIESFEIKHFLQK
ncbi:MAG: hypothetical protein KDD94_02080 [Calditrichaeota bacterium]|nr:hypothetical protein [Calditrichota bacterium]